MKKYLNIHLFYTIFFAVLFYSVSMQAQTAFEGKLIIEISSADGGLTMDYYLKDGKMKMIMKGENNSLGGMIMSGEKTIIMMEEQKMYMEMDNKTISKFTGMFGGDNEDNDEGNEEDIDFSKYRTGETKTILGYDCEKWVFDEDGDKSVAWVTDEIGSFQVLNSPMGGGYSPSWGNSLNNKGYFPLLVTSSDEDGEVGRFEVKSVDKTSLSNSEFEPPSGYTKMNIPGM